MRTVFVYGILLRQHGVFITVGEHQQISQFTGYEFEGRSCPVAPYAAPASGGKRRRGWCINLIHQSSIRDSVCPDKAHP
jgi:hypothetical protein